MKKKIDTTHEIEIEDSEEIDSLYSSSFTGTSYSLQIIPHSIKKARVKSY